MRYSNWSITNSNNYVVFTRRYEYMDTGYGNIAKMTINLNDLSIILSESR